MNRSNKLIFAGILLLGMQAAWVRAENTVAPKPETGIPFAESLHRADVEVATMKDGQRDSLLLGNGDLYGIVWEKDNGLFMRITKNDIWDARVDTSKDGDLPRVDPVTREVTGLDGAPPSYALPYPQPRCAVALRLGPVPEKMTGHLDLEKALVTIKSGEQPHTALRVLHQQNVLLIRGPQPVVDGYCICAPAQWHWLMGVRV